MQRWIVLVLLGFVVVVGFIGCKKKFPADEPNATPSLTVFPAGGSPGMIVHVTAGSPLFRGKDFSVSVGGQAATVTSVQSETDADVMVPQAPAGPTKLSVSGDGAKERPSADFTVLAARAQQLVLRWADNRIELMAVHPTSGEPSGRGEIGGDPQLSFEVMNNAGAIVYTGAIPNPIEQRNEVFDGPDAKSVTLRRESMPAHEVVFAVKVPKLSTAATVRFYAAPPGANLPQAQGPENRKAIGEVRVEEGGR